MATINPNIVLSAIPNPAGRKIGAEVNAYRQKQMQMDQFLLEQQLAEEKRKKMTSLSDFVGGQLAEEKPDYGQMFGQVSQAGMPLEALQMAQGREKMLGQQALNKAKYRPPIDLSNAAQQRFKSKQLLSEISNTEDPVLKNALSDEYNQLFQQFATQTRPMLLSSKDATNKVKELGILPLNDAMMERQLRTIEIGEKQAELTEKLREGAIKDSDFIQGSIKDYEQLSQREGFSLGQSKVLDKQLDRMMALAKEGNPSAIHALSVISNKGLDPNSAVLLSEAEALDNNSFLHFLRKQIGSIQGEDTRKINKENVYQSAKRIINTRANAAQKMAQNKVSRINQELRARGSERRITLDDLSAFGGLLPKVDSKASKGSSKTVTDMLKKVKKL